MCVQVHKVWWIDNTAVFLKMGSGAFYGNVSNDGGGPGGGTTTAAGRDPLRHGKNADNIGDLNDVRTMA